MHNIIEAVEERYIKPAEKALSRLCQYESDNKMEYDRLWTTVSTLAANLGYEHLGKLQPWTDDQVCMSFSGSKRKFYQRAFPKVTPYYHKWWAVTTPFVKTEKYVFYQKPNHVPRIIMPKTDVYRAYLSKYIKPIEASMKKWILPGCYEPFLAKGANSYVLADRFIRMVRRFKSPVMMSLDLSKFDATIGSKLKQLENRCFRKMSADARYNACLDAQEEVMAQLKVEGAELGPKRDNRIIQGRGSGDPQTGCGNSLLMAVICRTIFDWDCEFHVNGDDTIIVFDKASEDKAMERLQCFAAFGLDVKLEGVAYELEDVQWCQCYLTETQNGWKWVRDPRKVLATLFANVEYKPNADYKGLCAQIAEAELSQNPGQPIIAPICHWITTHWKKGGRFNHDNHTLHRAIKEHHYPLVSCPTVQDRETFAGRFGTPSNTQLIVETQIIQELQQFETNIASYTWTGNTHPRGSGYILWGV